MITRLTIKHFKAFEDCDVELGRRVVLIGPNNSGKSSALQALTLWRIGLNRWIGKYGTSSPGKSKRPGVAINRRDLLAIPVPTTKLLWKDLRVRKGGSGQKQTENIRILIGVEGISQGEVWTCSLEFDYANPESIYCRPAKKEDGSLSEIPAAAREVSISYLPPMSGLIANETLLTPGAIDVRIGEGRTAEVLRNLCLQVYENKSSPNWSILVEKMKELFGIEILPPVRIPTRGEISMSYKTISGIELDLSAAGRGQQQTLLLLAHLLANPQSILLLDEPDAHLEILRQRQIYELLHEISEKNGNQIFAASHSEVILNEAADRDIVIAFTGKPHRIDDRGSQVLKALKSIGFEDYYQAEIRGWVLYLEGPTDLSILQTFARKLKHPAAELLESPFVHYTGNQPAKARNHFYGLKEAYPKLKGIAIYDHLNKDFLDQKGELEELMWEKNEIENYFCQVEVLLAYAEDLARQQNGPLFQESWRKQMEDSIQEIEKALESLGKPSPWSGKLKVSDEFLTPLFKSFFKKLKLPNLMQKTDFHTLVQYLPEEQIPLEVRHKLDAIVKTAQAQN